MRRIDDKKLNNAFEECYNTVMMRSNDKLLKLFEDNSYRIDYVKELLNDWYSYLEDLGANEQIEPRRMDEFIEKLYKGFCNIYYNIFFSWMKCVRDNRDLREPFESLAIYINRLPIKSQVLYSMLERRYTNFVESTTDYFRVIDRQMMYLIVEDIKSLYEDKQHLVVKYYTSDVLNKLSLFALERRLDLKREYGFELDFDSSFLARLERESFERELAKEEEEENNKNNIIYEEEEDYFFIPKYIYDKDTEDNKDEAYTYSTSINESYDECKLEEEYSRKPNSKGFVVKYKNIYSWKDMESLALSNKYVYKKSAGGHRIYEHPISLKIIVIPAHELGKGLSRKIQKQIYTNMQPNTSYQYI